MNLAGISGYAYAEWFRLSHAFDEILMFMDCSRRICRIAPAPILAPIVEGGRPEEVAGVLRVGYAVGHARPGAGAGVAPSEARCLYICLNGGVDRGRADAQGRLTATKTSSVM